MKLISKYWWVVVLAAVAVWYFFLKEDKARADSGDTANKPKLMRRTGIAGGIREVGAFVTNAADSLTNLSPSL